MKRRRRGSPRIVGPRSPLASGRARADTVDRSRPRGISLLSLGRTEASMAEAARPERAALPSFSTFSAMAGLAAEALTVSLSYRGERGRSSSARAPDTDAGDGRGCFASVASRHDESHDLARRRARASASRARFRARKASDDSACASHRSRARSKSHRASRDESEPRANPVGANKTPHRSSERIAKAKISRWGLPPVTHRLLVRTAEARATTVVAEMQAIFLVDLKKVVRCVCKYGGEGGATIGVCPSPALPTKLCQLTGEYGSTNQKARRADFHGSVLNLCILPDFRRARWQR